MIVNINSISKRVVKKALRSRRVSYIVDGNGRRIVRLVPAPKPIRYHGRFPVYRREDFQYIDPEV
jgi:hypothetical protein